MEYFPPPPKGARKLGDRRFSRAFRGQNNRQRHLEQGPGPAGLDKMEEATWLVLTLQGAFARVP